MDVDDVKPYASLDCVYVDIDQQKIPFLIQSWHGKDKLVKAKLEDIDTIDQAKSLKGRKLFLPLHLLPEKTDESDFFYHEVIGYQLIEKQQGLLGLVEDVYDMPAQDMLVSTWQGKEIMIPIVDDFLEKIDHESKTVFLVLPDGFLEAYL